MQPSQRPDRNTPRLVSAVTATALMAAVCLFQPVLSVSTAEAQQSQVEQEEQINPCIWASTNWSQMKHSDRQAWMRLGWTQRRWQPPAANEEDTFGDVTIRAPRSSYKKWSQLTPSEQNAAAVLGFTDQAWNSFNFGTC